MNNINIIDSHINNFTVLSVEDILLVLSPIARPCANF